MKKLVFIIAVLFVADSFAKSYQCKDVKTKDRFLITAERNSAHVYLVGEEDMTLMPGKTVGSNILKHFSALQVVNTPPTPKVNWTDSSGCYEQLESHYVFEINTDNPKKSQIVRSPHFLRNPNIESCAQLKISFPPPTPLACAELAD